MNANIRTTPLSALQRPSGGYAMLAVDQREALRQMMADQSGAPVSDREVIDFKLTAARILTPYASAVLIDQQFAFDEAVAAGVVDPACGLIASADHFTSAHGELVGEVAIDRSRDFAQLRDQGAVAAKLLVLHRPDGGRDERREMVAEFVELCHRADLISIIEPVSRKPLSDVAWDWAEGVVAAAQELGALGADLYKAEVPRHGAGDPEQVRQDCRALAEAIDSEWVVLSSGVAEQDFGDAVRIACEQGASGFLAGRAVWASSLSAPDVAADLATNAVARLRSYAAIVDDVMGARA